MRRKCAGRTDPGTDDQERAERERPLEGFVEQQDRERRGEERRTADDDGRPAHSDVADREHEEDLRDAGGDQARKREDGELLVVGELPAPGIDDRGDERDEEGDDGRRHRRDVGLRMPPQPHADRDRHRPEADGRRESEQNGGHSGVSG